MLELPEARRMMREILDSDPDYQAPWDRCIYFDDQGNPVCAVGKLFDKIGITRHDMGAFRFGGRVMDANQTGVHLISRIWAGKISEEAADFLAEVQASQDEGVRWGDIRERHFGGEEDGEDQ